MPLEEHPVSDNIHKSEKERQELTISRRRLLKALAAAGGAIAASTLLPRKWTKPVVETGALPVHAQGSVVVPTSPPPPPTYSAVCDSRPSGGNITTNPYWTLPSGTGHIDNIEASLVIVSGTGPVAGITVTMTATPITPSTPMPTFAPALPLTAITDANGVANFAPLDVTGTPINFGLTFDFAVPAGGPVDVTCSIYELH